MATKKKAAVKKAAGAKPATKKKAAVKKISNPEITGEDLINEYNQGLTIHSEDGETIPCAADESE